MKHRWSIVLAVLPMVGLAPLAGCGESVSDWIAPRREAALAQLAKVAKVRGLSHAQAPDDFATMKDPGPMAICDLVIAPYREAGCDAWVINQAELDQPHRFLDPAPAVSFGETDWLVTTTSLLDTGRFPPNASFPDGDVADRLTRPIIYAFNWLETVRWVFVVRSDELVAPKLADDQKSYTPGSFRGEALLYALAPEPTYLGGVPFAYAMAGDLKVRMRAGVIGAGQIDKLFADGVRQSLADELVTRLHQLERPPPKPGAGTAEP